MVESDIAKSAAQAAAGSLPFSFHMPMVAYEKADAEAGKQRRIAGVMSSETRDRQGEIILQRGLDFKDFLANGWFNDNHTKDTDGVVGFPESVRVYQQGDVLPNGQPAKTNCSWVEGYMLQGHPRADNIWSLAQALQSTGRRLGFSVEGNITRRTGAGGNTIARATVRNTAVTNCPVNTDAQMDVLARSLDAIERAVDAEDDAEAVCKMLTVGAGVPTGPTTGAGAGAILARQDLERELRPAGVPDRVTRKRANKSMSDAQAVAWVRRQVPGVGEVAARDFVVLTHALKHIGIL